MSHSASPQLTLLIEDHPGPVRDVTSFFARLASAVETLPYYPGQLSQKIKEARANLIFVLDPELGVPLVEVFSFLGEFERDPNLLLILGSRTARRPGTSAVEADPLAPLAKITSWNQKHLSSKALVDPLCPFFAFRSEANISVTTQWLKAQEISLQVPPERQKILPVQGRARALSPWTTVKICFGIRRLARRFSNAAE